MKYLEGLTSKERVDDINRTLTNKVRRNDGEAIREIHSANFATMDVIIS